MKNNRIILYFAAFVASLSMAMTSCSEDEFTDTIFANKSDILDPNSGTFALDTFVKAEFLQPYNLKYMYKMEDVGSDMQKNLVPVSYDKSKEFAVLCKYLWFDVYKENVSAEFLKEYSPRIIHLIGSASYNPTSGTKTIGLAEGGVKVSLYQGNMINIADLDFMNEQFFKTMHHEFGHIMHQNHLYPTSFKLLSNGMYDPMDWNNTPDSVAAARGFISPYASSGVNEDWVEILSNYIVKDQKRWDSELATAAFDWEIADNIGADTIDYAIEAGITRDIVGYVHSTATENSDGSANAYKIQRKVISRDDKGHPVLSDGTIIEIGNGEGTAYEKDGLGWTTRNLATGEPVDVEGKLQFSDNNDGIDGKALILQKLEMVRTWAKDYFNMDIEAIRKAVQTRQYLTDANGDFVFDADGNYVNALLSPSKTDPSKTQMEVILEWVNKFEK